MKKMTLAVGLLFVCIDMQGASQGAGADLGPKIGDLCLWQKEGDKAVFGLINTNYQSVELKLLLKGCCGVLTTVSKKNGVVEHFIQAPQFAFEMVYTNFNDAEKDIKHRLACLEHNPPLLGARSKQVQDVFDQLTLAQKERKSGKGGLGKLLSTTSENVVEGKIEKVSHMDLLSTDDLAKLFYTTALAQIKNFQKNLKNKS